MNTEQWEAGARRSLGKVRPYTKGCEDQMVDLLRFEDVPYNELETAAEGYRRLYPCFFFANVHEGIR
jgi:hypothetical protein